MEQQNKTVNLAVVEDDDKTRERFCATIDEYGERQGISFCKRCFGLATDFLENYSPDYDIVFMDIQLPDLDGMSAAKKLREVDKSVTLVFVTNFAQYAINGYEVGATDFIVKPVEYAHFSVKFDRILSKINAFSDIIIAVKTNNGIISVAASELKYVEVMGHSLIYHTTHGNLNASGTLYKAESQLAKAKFVRCNSCYLVNPRYVQSINNYTTVVGGDELKISYAKKKDYRKAVADYLGGLV